MVYEKETLFHSCSSCGTNIDFFLKNIGPSDKILKMEGQFPCFWHNGKNGTTGPIIWNGEVVFKILYVDYEKKILWITIVEE